MKTQNKEPMVNFSTNFIKRAKIRSFFPKKGIEGYFIMQAIKPLYYNVRLTGLKLITRIFKTFFISKSGKVECLFKL